jgi:hypothetical protein
VLIESVSHHVREEEQDWFPKVRAGLGRNELSEIGGSYSVKGAHPAR